MTDEDLHKLARNRTEVLKHVGLRFDKNQLRYNEIVFCARRFYPEDICGGVVDLVDSCFVDYPFSEIKNPMYVKGAPMWETLNRDYVWMLVND
jgi:hypothetical protein